MSVVGYAGIRSHTPTPEVGECACCSRRKLLRWALYDHDGNYSDTFCHRMCAIDSAYGPQFVTYQIVDLMEVR